MDSLARYLNLRLHLPAANRNRPSKKARLIMVLKIGAAIAALFLVSWLAHQW